MSLSSRVLDGLGPALRARAGALLADLAGALTSQGEVADQLLQPTEQGWAAAFDVATTPVPAWLASATGTRIPAGPDVEEQREFLAGQPHWRRGTVGAMKAAVRTVLVGLTERVDVVERVAGDPYTFGLRVWASELPGGDSAPVVTAALTQKPLGLLADVAVEVVDHDATYAHLTAVHGSYFALAARFASGTAVAAHVPEEGTPD